MSKITFIFAPIFASYISGCVTSVPMVNKTNLNSIDFSDAVSWDQGKSCAFYLLGFIGPWNSSNSLVEAAKRENLQKVYVMEETYKFKFIGEEVCTIAYGKAKTQVSVKEGDFNYRP